MGRQRRDRGALRVRLHRDGKVIEEHDNIPGFREHDVWIDCDICRAEWRFVDGNTVRDWSLEPLAAGATN